ncbi:MAG: hypothetical protein WEA10_09755 [Actinomycetota bacterium]
MTIEFTDLAEQALERSSAAARRFNPAALLRAASASGGSVDLQIVEAPLPGDETLVRAGFTLLVASGLDGTLDVEEPHDRIVLRAPR